MSDTTGSRIDVTLVAGGMFHDIDFARLQLLQLLAEHEEFRVRVQPDYEDTDAIAAGSILVSYTCNVRPSVEAQERIRQWVIDGGRWVALHGTNSALDIGTEEGINRSIAELSQPNRDLTIVVIAHRESSLEYCDRIITLDNNG